jgi:hypothetical protein
MTPRPHSIIRNQKSRNQAIRNQPIKVARFALQRVFATARRGQRKSTADRKGGVGSILPALAICSSSMETFAPHETKCLPKSTLRDCHQSLFWERLLFENGMNILLISRGRASSWAFRNQMISER